MNFESYLDQVWASNLLIPVALVLLALTTVLLIKGPGIRAYWLEWRTCRCLDQIGIRQIRNAVCSDGLEGDFKIDRLVLLHDSILIVAFRPYAGNIYCADSIPEWTQILDQKSYKFKNPLFELHNQVTAIQNYLSDVNIRGILIFDHNASFPKGHPEQVMRSDNIPEYFLRPNCPEPRADVLRGWDALLKLPLRDEQIPLYQ